MRITAPPLDRDVMCAAITRILNAHGLHRVVLAGHSYGTAVSAHLLRRQWDSVLDPPLSPLTTTTTTQTPRQPITRESESSTIECDVTTTSHGAGSSDGDLIIAATLLIDPIPFLLHHPAVAHNFVYRQPRHANEWQLWYFASREPDTARALSRHFFWFECILFREDVLGATTSGGGRESTPTSTSTSTAGKTQKKKKSMPITVSLSGRDQIVDARAVRAYLTDNKDHEDEDEGGEERVNVNRVGGKGRAGVPPSRWEQDGLEVLYFAEMDHATVFDTPRDRAPLLGALHRFVRLDEDEEEDSDDVTKSTSVNGAGGAVQTGNLLDVD